MNVKMLCNSIGYQKFESIKKEIKLNEINDYVVKTLARKSLKRELSGIVLTIVITVLGYGDNINAKLIQWLYINRLIISIVLCIAYVIYFVSSYFNMQTYMEVGECTKRALQEQANDNKVVVNVAMRSIKKRIDLDSDTIVEFSGKLLAYMVNKLGIDKNCSIAIYELKDSNLWMPGYCSNQSHNSEPQLYKKGKNSSNIIAYEKYYFWKCMNDDCSVLHILKNKNDIERVFFQPKKNYSQYGSYRIELEKKHVILVEVIAYEEDKFAEENLLEIYFKEFFNSYRDVISNFFDLQK